MLKTSKRLITFILAAIMLFSLCSMAGAIDVFTVRFVSEGGGFVSADKPFYPAGSEVQITAVPHDGFVFFGWVADDINIIRTSELTAAFIMPARNVTIRAVFAIKQADEKEKVSVTFNTNGGTELNTTYVDSGSPVQQPATAPTKIGYTFAGWYANSTCTIPFDFSTPLYTSTIIYANWAVAPTVTPEKFNDVSKSDWFYKPVMELYEQKIISGMTANTFAPKASITRAQFATILANMSGAQLSDTATPFNDVKAGAWYAKAVSWAYSNGIVTGLNSDTFAPEALISRQDMAVMIMRYAEKIEKVALPDIVTPVTFSDSDTISSYAKDAVSAMQRAGIINGKPGNLFAPRANALRNEACKMIYEFLNATR